MKNTFLLLFIFISFIIYAAVKYPNGIAGTTKLNGEGCVCHTSESDPTVKVWVDGPDTLQTGQTGFYKIYLTGGPKVKGGYNVAARFGTLTEVDTFSHIIDFEITHSFPRTFPANDTVAWDFEYTAPTNLEYDTIYSVAMSVNGDEIPSDEDKWNFGNNFVVTIVPPVIVRNEQNVSSFHYKLEQNYPNPFNPSTKITYAIPLLSERTPLEGVARGVFVTLKVYDLLGNEVATLVNEYKPAGYYTVVFKIENGELPSGMYFYRLEVGNYSETRKMVLMR